MEEEIKENDIVLCKVKKIEKTTVFVDIEGNGQGSIVLSEIAAGRIRNLRDYVAPNKEVVCKVLKVVGKNNIELSLRRVTAAERNEVLDRSKKTKTFKKIIEKNVKNPKEVLKKIEKLGPLNEIFEQSREDPSILKKIVSKEEFETLSKILAEKREKDKEVKKVIKIKSNSSQGIKDIKEILDIKDVKINYLGSSKFSIAVTAPDFKQANAKIEKAIEEIEKRAKEKEAIIETK